MGLIDVPDDETLIAVSGGRCAECGAVMPGDYKELPEEKLRELKEAVRRDWEWRMGSEWIQEGWPKKYPAWLVREGFRCPFCQAPNLLVELAL